MTDPRITAALDQLDSMPFAFDVPGLVAVLRHVARLHYATGGEFPYCHECEISWPCYTARALAPLAELGGDP